MEIRAFHRGDRDQLTDLVNTHIAAVVPGWAVSVAALLGQLEREPAQYVIDPWVVERAALVGLRRDRVVAGAYLKRGSDARVMPDYLDAGEIAWLVCLPNAMDVGRALAAACVNQLDAWGVSRQYAEGDLPTPAIYGVPDVWPHVRSLLDDVGFDDTKGARRSWWQATWTTPARPDHRRTRDSSHGGASATSPRASRLCSTETRSASLTSATT